RAGDPDGPADKDVVVLLEERQEAADVGQAVRDVLAAQLAQDRLEAVRVKPVDENLGIFDREHPARIDAAVSSPSSAAARSVEILVHVDQVMVEGIHD